MKKIALGALMAVLCLSAVSAYNPPAGGESLYELSSPSALSGQNSVAAGGIYKIGPESLTVNPALLATEQRVVLNMAYTALFSSNDVNELPFGSAIQTGIVIPTKLYVYSIYLNGTFVPFEEMNLRNTLSTKMGMSKSITDKLDVGLGLNAGMAWGADNDWALSTNLGFLAKVGTVAFMKDFRYGVSVLNFGKNFNASSIGSDSSSETSAYPTIASLKAGVAATLFSNDIIKFGYSFDVTIPGFQNLIFDTGLKFGIKDSFAISVNEKINLVESIRGCNNYIPSVGFNFKFTFDIKNTAPVEESTEEVKENKFASYMESKEWSESEMTVSMAYKNLYQSVTAVSTGVDINLGMKDDKPPVIEIMFDDEDEE